MRFFRDQQNELYIEIRETPLAVDQSMRLVTLTNGQNERLYDRSDIMSHLIDVSADMELYPIRQTLNIPVGKDDPNELMEIIVDQLTVNANQCIVGFECHPESTSNVKDRRQKLSGCIGVWTQSAAMPNIIDTDENGESIEPVVVIQVVLTGVVFMDHLKGLIQSEEPMSPEDYLSHIRLTNFNGVPNDEVSIGAQAPMISFDFILIDSDVESEPNIDEGTNDFDENPLPEEDLSPENQFEEMTHAIASVNEEIATMENNGAIVPDDHPLRQELSVLISRRDNLLEVDLEVKVTEHDELEHDAEIVIDPSSDSDHDK